MKRCVTIAASVVYLAGGASPARAQGSGVMTHGSCATALGGAGVADPCRDGSAVLFGPGALALQSSVVGLGASGITTSGDFTFDYSGERAVRGQSTTTVPFGFASARFGDRLAAALGVFAPYGLHIFWPKSFEGRFVSYDTDLKNVYVQPTLSFRPIPRVSLGAGLDVVLGSIDLNQRLDLSSFATGQTNPVTRQPIYFSNLGVPTGTDFADANLSGSATGYGFHLGANAELADFLSLGVRYLHRVQLDYSGDARFSPVATGLVLAPGNPLNARGGTPLDALVASQFATGALRNQPITTSLTLPSQLVVGVALRPLPVARLLADYQRTSWSDFDRADIAFATSGTSTPLVLDYQDTNTWRLGAELAPILPLTLRAGFIYNTAAEKEFSVSPLLPEAERNYYSAGLGYDFGNRFGVDVAYQLVDQSARRGRVRGRDPSATEAQLRALNVGVYSADAHIVSATLSYHFGGWR